MSCSLDRLTLLGDADKSLIPNLQFHPLVKSHSFAKYPYKYQWQMVDGSVLQLRDPSASVADLRYEFNPSNWDSPYKRDSDIMRILRIFKNVRISRIDVALDIKGFDFAKARILDTRSREERIFKGRSKDIQTYYFGSRSSEEMIRIYNKAKEQMGSKKGKEYFGCVDTGWWRAEAEIKREKAQDLAEGKYNPFDGLIVTLPVTNSKATLDVRRRAMLYYLNDHPEAINELSPNTRREYKELMSATNEHAEIQLSTFYEENKMDLMAEVQAWLNLTNLHNTDPEPTRIIKLTRQNNSTTSESA